MQDSTKIKKKVGIMEFAEIIQQCKPEEIECTKHTFIRLSEKQRKIFTCSELKKIIMNYKPFLVGIQNNENYAVFYNYKNKHLKLKVIVDLDNRKIKIVTFYFIEEWQIPKI